MKYVKKMAYWMYALLEKQKMLSENILYNQQVREDLKLLTPARDVVKRQKEYVVDKLALCILILLAGGFLSLVLWIKDIQNTTIGDNLLYRKEYGQGDVITNLVAASQDEAIKIPFVLEEKSYTRQELNQLYEKFLPQLMQKILGENSSLDKVTYDLVLVTELEEYPFSITWTADLVYIDDRGVLLKEVLEKPAVTELTAQIRCGEYEIIEKIPCVIYNRAKPISLEEKLALYLSQQQEKTKEDSTFLLPQEYEGTELNWAREREYIALLVFLLTPVFAIVIFFCKDKDLHKLIEEREEEMRLDYPEIVSKLALYIGAGMTVQNAWNRIAYEYQKKKKRTPKETTKDKKINVQERYAYEEMLIAVRELESGQSPIKVYESFGRRCRIPCYTKLATLITQNVRKGSANLAVTLQQEAQNAFQERKHTARKLGEKAGTKMLVPMMLLLVMVMVIILVPAFMNQI